MKSHAVFASICLIFIIGSLVLFTGTTAGLTTTQTTLSLQGTIANPSQLYSYNIYQQNSTYYAENGTSGQICWSSTNFASVLTSTINTNETVFLKNGVYYLTSFVSSNAIQGTKIIGESMDGVIIDLKNAPTGVSLSQSSAILLAGSNLYIDSVTFRSYSQAILGLGYGITGSLPSFNDTVKNLRFVNCSSAGVKFDDGSYSIIDNIQGDNPFNVVCFEFGQQSNITISNIVMTPTLATGSVPGHVDDTISFGPTVGANISNINISNVIGNYSLYKAQGGSSFTISGVIDFAGANSATDYMTWGNQTWNDITVNNVYAYYAPALFFGYGFIGLTDSVFTNIHSSYAQVGGTYNGIAVLVNPNPKNVTISNVLFKDIFIDHAYGAGFNFLISGVTTSTYAKVSDITLQNLFLTNNNQAGDTYTSYWGTGGLNIGNQGNGINQFSDLRIENIYSTDDQSPPTDYYPIVFWTCGAAGSYFNITQITGGVYVGNVNNQPYVTPGLYNLTISN